MSDGARIQAAYEEFHQAIGKLEAALDHIEGTSPSSEVRVLLLNNSIVALSATIEEGIRAILESYLTILEDEADAHDWLRGDLQTTNVKCYVNRLKGAIAPAVITTSHHLHECLTGVRTFRLAKQEIVYNQANFRSEQFKEIAKGCGVREIWRLIAESDEVGLYFGEDQIEQRINVLIAKWNELFDERDTVVHRFSQASGWGRSRIGQAIELCQLVLRRLAECLVDDANTQLIGFGGRRGAQAVQ
jgi:hypothetical protein